MKLNKKGFTLIELIAVVVLLSIITVIVVPKVMNELTLGKERAYEVVVSNILTASKQYYEECEYGDITCSITSNSVEIPLSILINYGYLAGTNKDTGIGKTILNPKTKVDISKCCIKITKVVAPTTTKVTYQISSDVTDVTCNNAGNSSCPVLNEEIS